MSSYQDKYLKYKKKYLELKKSLKGGQFPCQTPPSSDTVPNKSKQTLYDIFAISWEVSEKITDPLLISRMTGNISWRLAQWWKEYSRVKRMKVMLLEYGTRSWNAARVFRTEGCLYNKGEVDGRETIQSRIDFTNFINEGGDVELRHIISPPEEQIGLVESVIGNTIGIGCSEIIQPNYEKMVSEGRQTYIIDYQNVFRKLIDAEKIRFPGRSIRVLKVRAIQRIKNFVNNQCGAGNFVIIVYKPSAGDYNITRTLDGRLVTSNADDFLLNHFFNNIPYGQPGDAGSCSNETDINTNIKKYLGSGLLQIPCYFTEVSAASSYDDLIFWVIGICFYRVYERYGRIDNIHLVTNDKQTLAGHRFKSLLDIGIQTIYQMKYFINPLTTMVESRIVGGTIEDPSHLLDLYLQTIFTGIDIGYNSIGEGRRGVQIDGAELENALINNRYDFGTIKDYLNPSSPTSELKTMAFATDIDSMRLDGHYEDVYLIPYFFYAHIKYIQYKKYNRNRTIPWENDWNGSMTDAEISALMPPCSIWGEGLYR
jgi:hypothetical protein